MYVFTRKHKSKADKESDYQETWRMLPTDASGEFTAVAIGIAKLGEHALVLEASKQGGGFVASGRASSVAAGRLSYVNGLKVQPTLLHACLCHSM